MSIYTRGGDNGQTTRMDRRRVGKADPYLEVEGTVDELNAQVGLCAAEAERLAGEKRSRSAGFADLAGSLRLIQKQLFGLSWLIARALPDAPPLPDPPIDEETVVQMETWIDRTSGEWAGLDGFVLPGACELSARLHVARTVCRRAERRLVRLSETLQVDTLALRYLNRLSDALFTAARKADAALGRGNLKLRDDKPEK
jgi:cob(I)alamin adenosyltransferase